MQYVCVCDSQDDDVVQCAVTQSSVKPATQPDTATMSATTTATATAAAAAAAAADAGTDEVCDSWQMDSLCPPPGLLEPVKYPPLHIFVSCY